MADTITAPATPGTTGAPVTPDTGAAPSTTTSTAPTIESASERFKRAGSWADAGFPDVAGMDVTDGGDEVPEVDGGVTSERAPNADTATDAAKPETDAALVVEGEFSQDEQGRWHRADGTMASADEIAAINAEIAKQSAPPASETEAAKPETEPKPENIVTLRRRDGTTREVIVDDPELAQEIRQNMNDGMRRREYVERSAALEAREAELNEFQTMLSENPEGIWNELPEAVQLRILTRGLAQHFDALVDPINAYNQNPSTRIAAVAEMQTAARQQEVRVQAALESRQRATEVKNAVASLVPETAPEEIAREFWDLARMKLTTLIDQGQPVTKDTVANQLASLADRFGFSQDVGAAPAAPQRPRITLAGPAGTQSAAPSSAPAQPPAAVPANDAARALAEKTQRRITLTQRNRANAAAVPPAGAGAAPVRLPPVPTGASIEDASKRLRTMRSWST